MAVLIVVVFGPIRGTIPEGVDDDDGSSNDDDDGVLGFVIVE